jgi:type IV secretory pathway TraG/TraD family ATPase VirD4
MMEFAATLIPPATNESQPFFTDAGRGLLYAVLLSYHLSNYEYTLADVLRPFRDMELLKKVIRRHPHTEHYGKNYFDDHRMSANLMATMQSKVLFFEPIAGCWEKAHKRVSIKEWAKSEYVLVLGNSEVSRSAIDTINRCIFKRVSDVLLDSGESSSRRSWVFLDEAADAGRLLGLISLAKKGRSKGTCIVLAFQSISGLRDPQLYGQFGTDELLGQIGTRFIGRLECPVTAQYVSDLIGEQEITAISTSYTSGQNSSSTTSYQRQVRKAVLPSQLLSLAPCNLFNGLTGYCIVRSVGVFKTNMDGKDLFEGQLIPPNRDVPEFVLRDPRSQILEPWTPEQAARFGINLTDQGSPSPKKRRKKKTTETVLEAKPVDPLKDIFE